MHVKNGFIMYSFHPLLPPVPHYSLFGIDKTQVLMWDFFIKASICNKMQSYISETFFVLETMHFYISGFA